MQGRACETTSCPGRGSSRNIPLLLSVSEKGDFKKSRRFLADLEPEMDFESQSNPGVRPPVGGILGSLWKF